MPELPEVETTRRGLEPLLVGATLRTATVLNRSLRQPVQQDLGAKVAGRRVVAVERRAKYLLVRLDAGALLIHLGMTGHLRVDPPGTPRRSHDHVEFTLADGRLWRFNDARRFGLLLWTDGEPLLHPQLAALGPEPFDPAFDAAWLRERARGRRLAVKPFLMDNATVVGVGNIYASEALFRAGIDPRRPAGGLSLPRWRRLADAVREVLAEAIAAGGTTIRDFAGSDGRPGYFRISLRVYDRAGEPCPTCAAPIRQIRLGQRSSYYCPKCQR